MFGFFEVKVSSLGAAKAHRAAEATLLRISLAIIGVLLIFAEQALGLEPVRAVHSIKHFVGSVPNAKTDAATAPTGRVPLTFTEIPLSELAVGRPHAVQSAAPADRKAPESAKLQATKSEQAGGTRSMAESPPSSDIDPISNAFGPKSLAALSGQPTNSGGALEMVLRPPTKALLTTPRAKQRPDVNAKALVCVDCSSNKILLEHNGAEPLPIASITKLLTAMVAVDEMNLDQVLRVPDDIQRVAPKKVGLVPGQLLTVRDLLHGMLVVSGNDCAEVVARAYPKGGRTGFIRAMNKKAASIGAKSTRVYTPSGLDLNYVLGRKAGRTYEGRKLNTASAEDVALIARHAFSYPLISEVASKKHHTMVTRNKTPKKFKLTSNDRLLFTELPIAGAKTGFTNRAGKCIVAEFKNPQGTNYMIVVLNSPQHFKAAAKVYKWAVNLF